jgi:two-component system nitrate/nitrite response regulator NarL
MCKTWKIINNKIKLRNFSKVNVTTVPTQPISKVLLVEDDLVFQGAFARVFAKMAGVWEIQAFQDGVSALEALAQPHAQFTLALIDIGLPDITGIEVIAKARLRFAELPILVTTTFSAEDTFLLAIRSGANGYLLKGDTETALRNSIELVLQGQYPVSPALARHLFRLAGAPSAIPVTNKLNLSPRELELLQLIAKGCSYATCADVMNISLSTVQTHIRNMYRKLEVCNQRQAITKAQSSGLLKF